MAEVQIPSELKFATKEEFKIWILQMPDLKEKGCLRGKHRQNRLLMKQR